MTALAAFAVFLTAGTWSITGDLDVGLYGDRDSARQELRNREHFFLIPGTRRGRRWKWEAVVKWLKEERRREFGELTIRFVR